MKLNLVIILFSCICISILYAVSSLSQPTEIAIKDASRYEGQYVIIHGVVTRYTETTSGNQIITITDQQENATTLPVFVEGKKPLLYGDHIQVRGTLQKYKGSYELVVNNPEEITVIHRWNNITVPLQELARHPENYRGLHICVHGFVEQIMSDHFSITDERGTHFIAVYSTNATYTFTSGDEILIGALFTYDTTLLRYILEVTKDEHYILPYLL